MKVISEYKLTQEQIKQYRDKGYEVYYGYENPSIKPGESVGFLLDTMYKSTIDTIEKLLHRKTKSNITIKYEDKTYNISVPNEWSHKFYEDNHWITIEHPILSIYKEKRSDYFEQKQIAKDKDTTNYVLNYFHNEVPEDLDIILNNFSRLYEVTYEDNLQSKLLAYASIKYYLENDIEYSKDVMGCNPDEEPMFECISFGDETYLEDMIYKESNI